MPKLYQQIDNTLFKRSDGVWIVKPGPGDAGTHEGRELVEWLKTNTPDPPPTPPTPPPPVDFGGDLEDEPTYRSNLPNLVTQARAYLALQTPTLPQTALAVKGIIRLLLHVVSRQL